jgi:eukaryotic-like serine/threonine-protein kinase
VKKKIVFETIDNSYETVGILGQGGAGVVYEVTDQDSNIHALKLLSANKVNREGLKRFKNEITFCSRNKHINVVTVTDSGIHLVDGVKSPFYVMPRFQTTLRKVMSQGIPPERVLIYFSQVMDGVEAAHLKGIWHRDLKPENVFYEERADQFAIGDFGIAHFGEEFLLTSVETRPDSRLANFLYAAPEQKKRGSVVDYRADIFALGLILNEMFTDEVLHGVGHRTIGDVTPAFSYLDELVHAMVSQSPDARPASIDAIKQELISRQNDFVSRQKISKLENTVIPTSEVDDPLILNPVKIIRADWDDGRLMLKLNHSVSTKWIDVFRNIGGYRYLMGSGPEDWVFRGDIASVGASSHETQQILDNFKWYLTVTNRDYAERRIGETRAQEERMRRELQERRMREEKRLAERQQVLSTLKI